jgi:hypothetical protein
MLDELRAGTSAGKSSFLKNRNRKRGGLEAASMFVTSFHLRQKLATCGKTQAYP